ESGYASFRNNPIYYADPLGDFPKIRKFLKKIGNKIKGAFKKAFGGKGAARTPSTNGGPVRNLPGGGAPPVPSPSPSPSPSPGGITNPTLLGMTVFWNWFTHLATPGSAPLPSWADGGYSLINNNAGYNSDLPQGRPSGELDVTYLDAASNATRGGQANWWQTAQNNTYGAAVNTPDKLKVLIPKAADIVKKTTIALKVVNSNDIENQRQNNHKQNNTAPTNEEKTMGLTGGLYKEVYYFNDVYWGVTPKGGLHNVNGSSFIDSLNDKNLIKTRKKP
ncbi:MAG: hypothetical protein HRT73_15965, partial [Flavobacteriales bacterium]|nr:hypothetical protein [Flavobacteriales bacterium]